MLSFLKRYILLLLLPPFGKLNSPEERRRGQFGLWLLLFLRVVRTVSACIRVTAIFGLSILLIEFQRTRDVTQSHDTSHDRVKWFESTRLLSCLFVPWLVTQSPQQRSSAWQAKTKGYVRRPFYGKGQNYLWLCALFFQSLDKSHKHGRKKKKHSIPVFTANTKKERKKELHCTIVEDIFAVCPKRDGQHLPCLQSWGKLRDSQMSTYLFKTVLQKPATKSF